MLMSELCRLIIIQRGSIWPFVPVFVSLFVIAAIDCLLELWAYGKVCPVNKWPNILQHQEKKQKTHALSFFFLLIMACLTVKPSSFTHSRGGCCPLTSLWAAVVNVFITRRGLWRGPFCQCGESFWGLKTKGAKHGPWDPKASSGSWWEDTGLVKRSTLSNMKQVVFLTRLVLKVSATLIWGRGG